MYGKQNGKKIFSIPVEWVVTETIDIKADSLQEAIAFILDKSDEIPLGTEPEYIDGTWKISADESNTMDIEEIIETLDSYGYTERIASEYDDITELQ